MSNYNSLKATINANIKTNGNEEITGAVLNAVLTSMVDTLGAGYQFAGVATASTNPGTPDSKVFYFASSPGTYTHFAGFEVSVGQICLLKYDTSWHGYVVYDADTYIVDDSDADLDISDPRGATIVRFADGHIKTKNFDSANIETDVLVRDNDRSDLDISDENGNAIVRFQNGHVKTKEFDSEGLANLSINKFAGKKIAILGDSISTFNGWLPSSTPGYTGAAYVTYYPHGSLNSVTQTWWHKVARKLGLDPAADVNNCSWSGSCVTTTWSNIPSDSTASAAPGCSTRRVADLSVRGYNPDIVLVFISCNDWAIDTPIGTWKPSDAIPQDGSVPNFRDAYALMLNKIHEAYPLARIFCLTNLDDLYRDRTPGFPSNNNDGVSTYEWNQNIVEIAGAFGCEVIDVHNCGINYSNLMTYVVDTGLHPNELGMELIANKVANELILKY